MAGARVELSPEVTSYESGLRALAETIPPRPLADTVTDENGFFNLAAPSAGLWRLRVEAAGHRPAEERLVVYLEEEELDVLHLRPGRQVDVLVVDPRGQPVPGALVASVDGSPDGSRPGRGRGERGGKLQAPARLVRADEAGRVRIDAAEDRPLRLAAFAASYAPSEVSESPGGTVRLRLRRGRGRLVEVRDRRGAPVPGALVRVGELGLPAGLTDATGRLTLAVPEGEPLPVAVEDPGPRRGQGELTPPSTDAVASDAEVPPVVVALHEPVILSGRVLAAGERSPVMGAVVWEGRTPGVAAFSDRTGSFSLSLPPPAEEGTVLLAVAGGYLEGFAGLDPPEILAGHAFTLLLSAAAEVAGVVVDSTGAPLPGSLVEAFREREPDRKGRRARATRGGRFHLPTLVPGGPYRIEARKEGFAPATGEIPNLEAGRRAAELRLVLHPGHTAFGHVVDGEDRPIRAAEVQLLPSARAGGFPVWISSFRQAMSTPIHLTDADGRFTVEDLGEGSFDLLVRAEGFAPTSIPGVEIPGGTGAVDLGIVALEPAAAVEGRVVDRDGNAIGGALVRARPSWGIRFFGPEALRPNPETLTDAAGLFRLEGFRPGAEVELELSRRGFARTSVGGVTVPAPEPLEIVLEAAARVSGTVTDSRGEPVSEAEVAVGFASAGSAGEVYLQPLGNWAPALTDEAGRFAFEDLPAGELSLQARAPAYQQGAVVHVELKAGREVTGVRLALERGAVVEGRVVGPDGEPLVGAWVQLQGGVMRGRWKLSDTTDGDGRFRLEGVAPGSRSFDADHRDYPRKVLDLEVQPGDNYLEFVLAAGFEIRGRVLDPDGAGLAGASVTLAGTGGHGARASSGGEGDFIFRGVSPGSYQLQAEAKGFAAVEPAEPLVVDGADVSGLVLQLAVGGRLRGRILGLPLAELAGVEVIAHRQGPSTLFGRSDFEGKFLLEGAAPGDWTLRAQRPDGRSVSKEVTLSAPGEEALVELEFEPGVTLRGRVLQEGRPMADVQVAVFGGRGSSGGSGGFISTNPEGRFHLEDLSPGTYTLRAYSRRSGLIDEREIDLESDREVEIEIPGGRVSGSVVDAADESPIEGVAVRLRGQDGGAEVSGLFQPRNAGRGVSDIAGAFRILHVAAGSYRLVAVKEGYGQVEIPVLVEAGQEVSDLEVRLRPAQGVELRVSVVPGHALPPRVRVLVADPAGRPVLGNQFMLGQDGRVSLNSLPDGEWRVLVEAPGLVARPAELRAPGPPVQVTLVPGATVELSVPALAAEGAEVTLTVLDATGRPLLPAAPRRIPPGGSLNLPDFPPGSWTLGVATADGRTWAGSVSLTPGVTARLVLE